MVAKFTLTISDVIQRTPDAYSVRFRQPALKKVKYIPGQYITLILNIGGEIFYRPYSLSSCPLEKEYLEITVKKIPGGIASNHLCTQLKKGDVLEIIAPQGDFHTGLIEQNDLPICFWAIGSGITPIFSMIKELLQHTEHQCVLVFGNKKKEDKIFSDEWETLQATYGDRLVVWEFYSRENFVPTSPKVHSGRIEPSIVLDYHGKAAFSHHFICGPAPFKINLLEFLHQAGISTSRLHTEDFSNTIDAQLTQSAVAAQVTLKAPEKAYNFSVSAGQNILDAGLLTRLPIPYSCKTGACKLCAGRVIEGNYFQVAQGQVVEQERNNQEVLLCSTFPLSDHLIIELQ